MKRHGKLLLVIAGAIVALVFAVVVIIATFDWNRAKPWVVATVSQAIGRSLAIDGNLGLEWRRDSELDGWRSWVPTPHVTAEKVSVGNVEWGKTHEFGTAERVEFDLAVLPLLTRSVFIERMSARRSARTRAICRPTTPLSTPAACRSSVASRSMTTTSSAPMRSSN